MCLITHSKASLPANEISLSRVRACVCVCMPNRKCGSSATAPYCTAVHIMDRLYPNFHSLHATPAEPLEPRFKRRSWNAFPENPLLPYTVYTPVQEATLQKRRHQRCSSEAPTSQRVSTFLPDSKANNINDDEVDDGAIEDAVEETINSVSPIPPIAVVKPTVGRIDGRRIHRPQPCYGLPSLPSLSNDLLPPYMQMSTPEVYFNSLGSSSFKQPTASLPRRRTQLRRERAVPVARHSVFEYPNVVDYGPLQNAVMQDLTLRRRVRRHPEAVATEPLSRRRPFGGFAGIVPTTSRPTLAGEVEQSSAQLVMPNPQPPVCGRMERQGRSTRVSLDGPRRGQSKHLRSVNISKFGCQILRDLSELVCLRILSVTGYIHANICTKHLIFYFEFRR